MNVGVNGPGVLFYVFINMVSGNIFLATRPLEIVAVDYTTLERTNDGCENVLVFTQFRVS